MVTKFAVCNCILLHTIAITFHCDKQLLYIFNSEQFISQPEERITTFHSPFNKGIALTIEYSQILSSVVGILVTFTESLTANTGTFHS